MHFQRRNSAKKRCNVGTFSGLHPSSYFAPLLHEHREGIVNLYQRLCCYAYKNADFDTASIEVSVLILCPNHRRAIRTRLRQCLGRPGSDGSPMVNCCMAEYRFEHCFPSRHKSVLLFLHQGLNSPHDPCRSHQRFRFFPRSQECHPKYRR